MDYERTINEEYHRTGVLKCRWCSIVLSSGKVVRDGLFESWYPDGTPEIRGYYSWGAQVGLWREWWPNGKLREQGEYVEGAKTGAWLRTDSSGTLLEAILYRRGIDVLTASVRSSGDSGKVSELGATSGMNQALFIVLDADGLVKQSFVKDEGPDCGAD